MARKTVWIPLVSLSESTPCDDSTLLELAIEPGGYGGRTEDSLQTLRGHGLAAALSAATAALGAAGLQRSGYGFRLEPPVWFLVNPEPRLSNSAGAGLGVALGWLLYDGRCPGERLIASGQFDPADPLRRGRLRADPHLAVKLESALQFSRQPTPLPFVVPAETIDGVETRQQCAPIIRALAALNIQVLPVDSLVDATNACWRLTHQGCLPDRWHRSPTV